MKHKQVPYIVIAILCIVIGGVRYTVLEEWPLYMHLIVLAGQFALFVGIWQLILLVNDRLEKRFNYNQSVLRIFIQVFISLLLVTPVLMATFLLARPYLPSYVNSRYLTLLYVLAYLILLLLNFGFFAHKFFIDLRNSMAEKSELQLKAAGLEKEKIVMQYHHLKNQVNPHFLFNTLTSLDGLIHTNPELASEFLKHLSKVYRYVLEHKENEVVDLDTELEFIKHYIELLSIKYNNAIKIVVDVPEQAKDRGIVMVTLQMLIDNATKHNMMSHDSPLVIEIKVSGDYLIVKNNKQERRLIELSTRQGLQQLQQIYSYHETKPVEIIDSEKYFEVRLPLL